LATTAFSQSWPLGKFSQKSSITSGCPSGYSCRKFEISCPGVNEPGTGTLAVASAHEDPRGLVMFFTGGSGKSWWTAGEETHQFAEDLRVLGFAIVQVKWSGKGWLRSSPGNDAGIAHLACRPATVIQYVHEKYYVPLGIHTPIGKAGFCITGNSGGASQISYALSHYGLDQILDVVIPTGGPPHTALAKSCMNNPDEERYWFPLRTRKFIDTGFGFFDGNGPCANQNSSFIPRWNQESPSTGGNDYFHPTTRIKFLFGKSDRRMRLIAKDYFRQLRAGESPYVSRKNISNTSHSIAQTEEGLTALKKAILDTTP
jgi:hypothetical protein